MQAYKMKGTIDSDGYLIIRSPIKMSPGEVEAIVVLQPVAVVSNDPMPATVAQAEISKQQRPSQIKSLRDLLASAPSLPTDFDPERAKWEYLKTQHNL